MIKPRPFIFLLAAAICLVTPEPTAAQFGKVLEKAKKHVGQAKETVDDAREIRCDVQGVCGEVTQAGHFAPESYESVAVTVFDGTAHYRSAGIQGMVRDMFESVLVGNGFLLAANSDAASVREMIAKGEGEWADEELEQLKDFIHGIDAVIVVEIRQLEVGRCQISDGNRYGSEATVHLSVRWLNVDAGDVPWVATHSATECTEGGSTAASTEALETVASQLATTLPVRDSSSQ